MSGGEKRRKYLIDEILSVKRKDPKRFSVLLAWVTHIWRDLTQNSKLSAQF